MSVFLRLIFFCIVPFSYCGLWIADCGALESETQNLTSEIKNPKSEISRDAVIRLFTDANEKYLQAAKLIAAKDSRGAGQKLDEAALQYETILANGFQNGQIYYNLGNTYYRLGKLGKAIVNYRRARQFIPRNADLDANLKLVKSSTEDKELSNETPIVIRRIFFWFFLFNQNELTMGAVFLYGILMILLFFLIVLKYPWLKKIIIGFSAGLFIVVVSLGVKIYVEQGKDHGVVIATKCHVRYGPGEEYELKFEIHDGAECVIEDEKNGWYKVYVHVGVKQGIEPKTGTEEKASKEVRGGWLLKKDVEAI